MLQLLKCFILNDQNPSFMKEISYCSPNLTHWEDNLYVNFQNNKVKKKLKSTCVTNAEIIALEHSVKIKSVR